MPASGKADIYQLRRARTPVKNGNVSQVTVANPLSVDWVWWITHSTARKDGGSLPGP